MSEPSIWVLADPRAGTANQAIGIAERLERPFRTVALAWSAAARVPWPWPTLWGLTRTTRARLIPPWPALVIAAGRRAAPVALWLARHGARTVHAMHPGFGARGFDLLVVGQHDAPALASNMLPILGATHRVSPARLAAARQDWATFGGLPGPRVGLLLGGPVRGEGLQPADAIRLARIAGGRGASVLATTSRRTGRAAGLAVAQALAGVPHRLHLWGEPGHNPYLGILAWADRLIVSGDSISMLSEALATSAPVLVSTPDGLGARHVAFHKALEAKRLAFPIERGFRDDARDTLDETGRVADVLRVRGLLGGGGATS